MTDFQMRPTENGFQMIFTAPPYEDLLPNGTAKTTLWQDFAIANASGIPAIKDTFKRVMAEWGKDIDFMIELAFCVNAMSWRMFSKFEKTGKAQDKQMSALYADCYDRVQDHVYGDESPFTKAERTKYFQATD